MLRITKILRDKIRHHNKNITASLFSMELSFQRSLIPQFKKINPQIAAQVCNLFFGFACAYAAATMTWNLIPEFEDSRPWTPPSTVAQKKRYVDLDDVELGDFFGKGEAPIIDAKQNMVQANSDDAPETTLTVGLKGTLASSDARKSLAVIESNGQQAVYALGEEVEGTTAKLVQVFADRVILSYLGNLETLMLDGVAFHQRNEQGTSTQPGTKGAMIKAKPISPQVKAQLKQKHQRFLKNPKSMAEFISIVPVRKNGSMKGYRLNPKSNPQLFKDVGLKPNDLAVSINGYDLTDISQSMKLAQQMQELRELNLVVERNGQLIEISIEL
jgi:general secretion pathway protein C